MTRVGASLGFSICLFTLVGCGMSRGDVAGKVTYKNKAVKVGSVMMIGHDSLPHYSEIYADGTYEIKGVPAGEVKVIVSSVDPSTEFQGGPEARRNPGLKKPVNKDWFPLPLKYADHTNPAITTRLQSGKNSFDIVLE